MSDSGFSGLPPGPRTGDISLPQSIIELKAKIIELRGELKVMEARERMIGEVVRNNPDGTTVIKTDKGEITVELRGRDVPPVGAKVELELPPGDPPRQVIIRPLPPEPPQAQLPQQPASTAPAAPAPPRQTPAPSDAGPQPQRQDSASVRQLPRIDVQTVEELARHIETQPTGQQQAPIAVQPQDLIRLLPLPQHQIIDIIRPLLETIQTQVTPLPQQPQIALPDALFEQISPLLTLPRVQTALLLHDLPEQLPIFTQATSEPFAAHSFEGVAVSSLTAGKQLIRNILQLNAQHLQIPSLLPVTILPSTPEVQPDIKTQLALKNIATLSFTPPAQILADIKTPLQAFLTQPTAPQSNPFPIAVPTGPLDARIQTILPPQVKILTVTGEPVQIPKSVPALHLPTAIPSAPSFIPGGLAGSLNAEIIGYTPQNLPVLSFFISGVPTPQHFVMQFQTANLPVGAQVQMTPLPGASMQADAATPFIPFEFFSDFNWPALQELAQTLQQSAPQAAQILNNIVVNAVNPTRMPVAALFFIAAARSGDMSGWLGDKTIDAIRRAGKGDILTRLGRDMAGLQKSSAEPSGEWRATTLPMLADGQLHKMMLYFRHDGGQDNETDEKKRGTRFIFDLNLNRLGDVQLDGLHRPGRLDLIVRTKNALSPSMQQKMRRTYIEALEQTNVVGELSFQNKPNQFIKIEMPKKAAAG